MRLERARAGLSRALAASIRSVARTENRRGASHRELFAALGRETVETSADPGDPRGALAYSRSSRQDQRTPAGCDPPLESPRGCRSGQSADGATLENPPT